MELVTLPLEGIRTNGGTQPRVETNEAAIAEYAEVIRFGGELPPVIVFDDGAEIWLADGFHRFHAHRKAGAMEIACDVRQGTKRDAILFSVGANASHGLRRSNEDKRKAVMTLLNDSEWSSWTQAKIAETCGVSREFVSRVSSDLAPSCDRSQDTVRTVERNGKTYQQNTANIGKARPAQHTPEAQGGMAAAPAAQTTPPAVTTKPAHEAWDEWQETRKQPPAAEKPPVPASEVELLREQLDELRASMKETLADNEMMGRVFDADDRIKAAMDEAKRQKAIADNAERTLAAKNGEYIERARAVTYWQNRAQKAEKELAKIGRQAA